MNISKLRQIWSRVAATKEKKGFKALRLTSTSIPDLFVGIDKQNCRCLILFLPVSLDFKIKNVEKEKLRLEYIISKNAILITLEDPDFNDLFNDLVLSLYFSIYQIDEARKYSYQLISDFYKWTEFFEDQKKNKLSSEEVIGIFGELFKLNELLIKSTFHNVDGVLKSWQGPFDKTHDFVFELTDVEIKTKELSKPFIKISSEYQLENTFDKGLELLVISIVVDLSKGKSIYDLILAAIENIRRKQGDIKLLLKAIYQKGLTVENAKEYNNHRFTVIKSQLFNCMADGFPKLSISNIPEHISKLNYQLRVSSISEFITKEKEY